MGKNKTYTGIRGHQGEMDRRMFLVRTSSGALALLGGGLLAACGDGGSPAAVPSTTTGTASTSTVVGSTVPQPANVTQFLNTPGPSFLNALDAVATEMGFFSDEAIELSTDYPGNSIRGIQTLAGGSGSAVAADSFALLVATGEQIDLRSIYLVGRGYSFGFVVKSDSPIQEWSVDSVAGARIGVTELGGGEVPVLRGALARLGLSEGGDGGVELVPIGAGGPETADAIESGSVDIIAASILDFEIFKASGIDLRRITPAYVNEFPGVGYTTTPEILDANRDPITRLLRAKAKATVFTRYNLDAATEMAIAAAPASAEGIPPELIAGLLKAVWIDGNDFAFDEDNADYQRLGVQNVSAYDDYQQFLVETGIEDDDGTTLTQLVDVAPVIDNSLIDDINDFDYQEIKALAEWS